MAEIAGVVLTGVGLASLFNNAIDWFEYIYIGKNFGPRFRASLLRLDNARLRLSRWGDAVGLSGGVDDATISNSSNWTETEKHQAEQTLRVILEHFDAAKKISVNFRHSKTQEDPSVRENDVKTDLDPMGQFLHDKMRNLSIRRQNRTSLFKKARFAIYDEKHLAELINKISSLTDELIKLFPPKEDQQQQLCKGEMAEFTDSFRVLSAAAKGQDELLTTAIDQILNTTNNLSFHNRNAVIQAQGVISGGRMTQNVGSPFQN